MNKTILKVMDDGFEMFTILVNDSDVKKIKKIIKDLHDKFFDLETNDELEEKYGGYYEFILEHLNKINYIELIEKINVLEL